jgi:isopenicillin N synthase-like dioxygenase
VRTCAGADLSRAEQLSCGEHTDYGMLTIVNQDEDVAALQVKNAAGQWITAAPVKNSFVCNIGDMMRVWTNGLYKPTLHRVVNPSLERSRISIPYFHEPGFDTVVKPVVGLFGSSLPPRIAAKHYGSHLESKVFSNFEL